MEDPTAWIREMEEAEVKDLGQTIVEFFLLYKKHLFDEDQRIASGYEESIRLMKEKIAEIKGKWITSTT